MTALLLQFGGCTTGILKLDSRLTATTGHDIIVLVIIYAIKLSGVVGSGMAAKCFGYTTQQDEPSDSRPTAEE